MTRRIAALSLDDVAELLDARAARQRARDRGLRARFISRVAGQHEHARGETHGQVPQVVGSSPFQRLDRLDDLVGVADGAAERRDPSP